jgi:hypothetical protein
VRSASTVHKFAALAAFLVWVAMIEAMEELSTNLSPGKMNNTLNRKESVC